MQTERQIVRGDGVAGLVVVVVVEQPLPLKQRESPGLTWLRGSDCKTPQRECT